ncbi:hypothetical protein, partial [Escherichia coli]|uniref:hypothetical protein n=1 Tax=Escherichia coli TaxID=562 RepID=UPI001AA0B3C2
VDPPVDPPEEEEPVLEPIMVEEERTLGSYASTTQYVNQNPVNVPGVEANNFELRGPLITMVQNSPFYGKENEDANLHIT